MTNKDVAKKIVDRIVELINSGESLPWVKPWNQNANVIKVVDGVKTITITYTAWNRKGVPYKGVNRYLPDGEYITFRQCELEGGKVKKGAKALPVVYWSFEKKEVTHPDGSKTEEVIPFLKYYQVFNVSDCEGIPRKHRPVTETIEIPITHTEINTTSMFSTASIKLNVRVLQPIVP